MGIKKDSNENEMGLCIPNSLINSNALVFRDCLLKDKTRSEFLPEAKNENDWIIETQSPNKRH